MKKTRHLRTAFLYLFSIVILALPTHADDPAVAAIRKAYQTIEDEKSLVKKHTEISSKQLSEDSITRYEAKNGDLKKLMVKILNEDGETTERYYYSDGSLFFVFIESQYLKHNWELDAMGEQKSVGEPLKGTTQTRLYFADEKCIRHLVKQAEGATRKEVSAALHGKKNQNSEDGELANRYRTRGDLLAKVHSEKDLRALHGR